MPDVHWLIWDVDRTPKENDNALRDCGRHMRVEDLALLSDARHAEYGSQKSKRITNVQKPEDSEPPNGM